MEVKKPLTYISLFSSAGVGCHGFSLESFDCIATVELLEKRLQIQRYNKKCAYESGYIADDITKASTKEKIFSEIAFWKDTHKAEVDVILATPPCQGMSVANHKKGDERKRNSLVVESLVLVATIRPKIFIFENVRAFLTTECTDTKGNNVPIKQAIELELGGHYNIHYQVLNFKDYGTPSSRTRTIVIGVRKDIPEVTPIDLLPARKKGDTLREAIGDLAPLSTMGEIDPKDIYHNFRPYAPHMRAWIEHLAEGESAFSNKDAKRRPQRTVAGKVVQNENKNGDKYARCFWDRPGPCIHTRNDILASQATVHPRDDRVFSIRELMELMSIPASFKWNAASLRSLNALSEEEKRAFLKKNEMTIRQSIGEAVPTVIFQSIARNIRKILMRPGLSDSAIQKIILKHELTNLKKLKRYLILNLKNYRYWELAKIIELANAERSRLAAYYTRQDICFTLIKDLPDASNFEHLKILEPAVGAGNFLPLLIEKYRWVKEVEIDVVDIDPQAIEILKVLARKLDIPSNIKLSFITADFLLHSDGSLFGSPRRYDIAVGNPPFGKITEGVGRLIKYKTHLYNTQTNNLFSFFLEKCLRTADHVALIIPKAFLSAPEFNLSRELVSQFAVRKITDYGEKAFKGVKIETISLIVDTQQPGGKTLVESYVKREIGLKEQAYICSSDFPYWLVYRNDFFDGVAKKLKFNVFSAFRDRQITKKITRPAGAIRVLKSRNIADNKIINIPAYDSYVDRADSLIVSKFLNKTTSVLVPNLTYSPRACFLPEGAIVDGSVAILTLKEGARKISKKDLAYYGSEEFEQFYRVARNFGTRSLNIDSNSVFFLGIKR